MSDLCLLISFAQRSLVRRRLTSNLRLLSLAAPGDVKPAHDARCEWSRREWSRWEESDIDGQTREGEASGIKPNQAVRHGQAKRG